MCFGLKCGKADRLSYPFLLRRVITAKERHTSRRLKKGIRNHACGKTANMRKIGNAATITGKCIRCGGDELATNPDAENDQAGRLMNLTKTMISTNVRIAAFG